MKRITFYLDFISPHARLAFEELPRALMGLSYAVRYRPLLLADIPDYPVIPMRLLCLAVASDPQGDPNRYVCESLFQRVWRTDADTDADANAHADADAAILAQLHANGVRAMAHGISTVPAFELEGRIFCGLDSLPTLRACLEGSAPVHR